MKSIFDGAVFPDKFFMANGKAAVFQRFDKGRAILFNELFQFSVDIETGIRFRNGRPDGCDIVSKAKSEYDVVCWSVSERDFSELGEYDTSKLNEMQKEAMIDTAAEIIANNEYISDCFWQTIHMVARNYGLKTIYEAEEELQ